MARITRSTWQHYRLYRNVLCVYILTFAVVLPLLCAHLQNTMLDGFYNRNPTVENARLIQLNAARYNKSVDTLKTFASGSNAMRLRKLLSGQSQASSGVDLPEVKKDSFPINRRKSASRRKVDMVITIVTVSRADGLNQQHNPGYLVQTLAAFLELFNSQPGIFAKFSPLLRVCNVDPVPGDHADMRLVPDWVTVYQKHQTPLRDMSYDARFNKEKNDYVYCLDKSLEENTSLVLIVEDDAIPRDELFSVMEAKLFSAVDSSDASFMIGKPSHNDKSSWDGFPVIDDATFIKLYHPKRLLSYNSCETDRVLELVSIGVVLTSAVMLVYYLRACSKMNSPAWIWASLFILFCLAIFTIGRSNMLELRRVSSYFYHVGPAPSCCTQAMLFPRQGAYVVSEYLKTVTCKPGFAKDSALDNVIRERSLVTKLVVPNLFEHIGHFSSLHRELINPFSLP